MNLPAGLIDNRIEFFSDPTNRETSFALVNGQVHLITEAPDFIKQMILTDIEASPDKQLALTYLGYRTEDQQLAKYISCGYGAFDSEPDVVDGKLQPGEYWPCPKRGYCIAQGILCSPLKLKFGILSGREVEVLTLIGQGKLDKEIGEALCISTETAKNHSKSIRFKSGLENKPELVALAYQKNLI